jgi:hypothetical protein
LVKRGHFAQASGWEGAVSRTIRESENLPLSFIFVEMANPQAIIAWGFFFDNQKEWII